MSARMVAERIVEETVPELRAKRLRMASPSIAPPVADQSASELEQCNQQAKTVFRALVARVLGGQSIREQAAFFGVPHSTYNERISDRRGDLAPLDAWTEKLERHAEWQRLNAEFSRAG